MLEAIAIKIDLPSRSECFRLPMVAVLIRLLTTHLWRVVYQIRQHRCALGQVNLRLFPRWNKPTCLKALFLSKIINSPQSVPAGTQSRSPKSVYATCGTLPSSHYG